jgi:hypothetical protein
MPGHAVPLPTHPIKRKTCQEDPCLGTHSSVVEHVWDNPRSTDKLVPCDNVVRLKNISKSRSTSAVPSSSPGDQFIEFAPNSKNRV